MRHFRIIVCAALAASWCLAQPRAEEKAVLAVVQRFFDVLSSRDAAAGRSTILPDARSFAVRDSGAVAGASLLEFMDKLPARKELLREQMFEPAVRIHRSAAIVWTSYDFHRDGKFSHCGVDAFTLVKTPEGWKIASLVYTVEPSGCPARGSVERK